LEIFKTIILALVQGITEFFPVSSSGHLVLLEHLFKIKEDKLLLTIVLHAGTLFSVLFYYRKKVLKLIADFFKLLFSYKSVKKEERDYLFGILIVTIVTGFFGFAFKDFFESLFSKPLYVSFALLFTGIILVLTKFVKLKDKKSTLKDSVLIGLAQSFAIIPGISRSGSTISTALFLGWDKEESAEFSFIAFLPAMIGAIILEIPKSFENTNFYLLLLGFVVSFITGLLAIGYLIKIIKNKRFYIFGIYCIIISLLSFLYFIF